MNKSSPVFIERKRHLLSRIFGRHALWWLGLAGWLAVTLVVVMAFAAAQRVGQSEPPRYAGTPLDKVAANFQLTNQQGKRVSLADWRDGVVVLTFMDSRCEETCPITAAELRATSQALGQDAQSVVFAGVNVNVQANQVADVAAATDQWLLDEIPTWHFLTGSPEALPPVWDAYGVAVVPAEDDEEELLHTPGVFVIDQAGRARWYVSVPADEQAMAPLHELLVQHIQALLEEPSHE